LADALPDEAARVRFWRAVRWLGGIQVVTDVGRPGGPAAARLRAVHDRDGDRAFVVEESTGQEAG
jgi:hypothetical protein